MKALLTWFTAPPAVTAEDLKVLGKTITTAGSQEPYLNRLQFDLVYTY